MYAYWTVDSGFEQFNPVLELDVDETQVAAEPGCDRARDNCSCRRMRRPPAARSFAPRQSPAREVSVQCRSAVQDLPRCWYRWRRAGGGVGSAATSKRFGQDFSQAAKMKNANRNTRHQW